MKFAQKFMEYYLQWKQSEFAASGREPNKTDFASYLGKDQATVNQWLNGRRKPDRDSADDLAAKIGPEVYDWLGLFSNDPFLRGIQALSSDLTEEDKKIILDEAEKRAAERKKDSSDPKVNDSSLSFSY